MFKYKERILLKGIPGVFMNVLGRTTELDMDSLENNLDYDEELWAGIIHSENSDIMNGYFLEEDTNQWMIIKSGKCSGSLENRYESLEMLLEVESIWNKLKNAMEIDSLNRHSTTIMTHRQDFMEKYMKFLESFDSPIQIVNHNQSTYLIELNSKNKKIPLFCRYLHYNGKKFELKTVWQND